MQDAQVHEILSRVLASGIASPGAKLGEKSLADLFFISRDRMRRILHRLGHERKLELVPNRGARTIDPGLADARVVYEARRVLEGGIALSVTERITAAEIDMLFEQHERERDAIVREADDEALRMGGALHVGLAKMTGNPMIIEMLRSMVDRTSTLLSAFGPLDGPACSCREHSTIIEAVAARSPSRAREAMCSHLSLVETRLRMRPRCEAVDIETLIKAELGRVTSPGSVPERRTNPRSPSLKVKAHERDDRRDRGNELSGAAGASGGT